MVDGTTPLSAPSSGIRPQGQSGQTRVHLPVSASGYHWYVETLWSYTTYMVSICTGSVDGDTVRTVRPWRASTNRYCVLKTILFQR